MSTTVNVLSARKLPGIWHWAIASSLVTFVFLETLSAAPVIVTQPKSQIITFGASATLSVTASGAGTIFYQWRKEGLHLVNKTNAAMTLNNLQATNQGVYSVVVTDSTGSVTSSLVSLGADLIIQWQKTLGGDGDDYATAIKQTSDGGFLVGGHSGSGISGNKTVENFGSYDYWVVRLDPVGVKLWEKTFGGTENDFLYGLQITSDGGCVLAGVSFSGSTGNKTSPHFGGYDYWVIKLDANGNKQWEKTFGGTGHDLCSDIELTGDGGFILGGTSSSGISGNKTNAGFGGNDFWIIRLNSGGDKIWEKTFGGNNDDHFGSLQPTSDGSYLLGGHSLSEISGNKTNLGFGGNDYWVVKMDASGNKIWEQVLEGNNSDFYRAVRLGTNGSKLWDKTLGGDGVDLLFALERDSLGKYILGGFSTSGNSGDKTSAAFGNGDFWIIGVDPNGNKLWDKAAGGSGSDILTSLQETQDGGFLVSGYSNSGISGNKTTQNLGGYDYWVAKLAVATSTLIFEHPQSQTNNAGANINLSVQANNALGYQWRKNGNSIIGATLSFLNFPNFHTNDVGFYDALVVGGSGTIMSSNAYLFLTGVETNPPTVSIVSPKASQRLTNSSIFPMSGTAKDAGLGVAQVLYRLNGGPFQLAEGTDHWTANLALVPGTNRVEVKSVDFGGTEASKSVSRVFYSVVLSELNLTVAGSGTVASTSSTIGTPTNQAVLEVGRSYTVKAIPGLNHSFSNWTGSAASPNASFTFVMQSNMTLNANFVFNPFISRSGTYNGLFYQTNLSHQTAGFFTLKVKTNFTFTGKVILDGDPIVMSGKFNVDGTAVKVIPRAKLGKPDLTLALALDFETDSEKIFGTVSTDSWSAPLVADRAIFSANNPATAFAGIYTMLLPGLVNPLTGPPGYGYGSIKVKTNGSVVFTGETADGMKMSQSVTLSKTGEWPLYAYYYKVSRTYTNWITPPAVVVDNTYYLGSSCGWINLAGNTPTGNVRLIKTGWTNAIYASGFTNVASVLGSRYSPPAYGTAAVVMTDGVIEFIHGNLSTPLIGSNILIKANNYAEVTSDHAIKFSIAPGSGLMSGTFQHPQNNNALTPFKGALLQEQRIGAGYFLGTNRGGLVILDGN